MAKQLGGYLENRKGVWQCHNNVGWVSSSFRAIRPLWKIGNIPVHILKLPAKMKENQKVSKLLYKTCGNEFRQNSICWFCLRCGTSYVICWFFQKLYRNVISPVCSARCWFFVISGISKLWRNRRAKSCEAKNASEYGKCKCNVSLEKDVFWKISWVAWVFSYKLFADISTLHPVKINHLLTFIQDTVHNHSPLQISHLLTK